MSLIVGSVINISLETDVKKKDGGTYRGWELIYKTPEGEVHTLAKPVTGLNYNAPLKKALSELVNGDEFTAEVVKNAAGFLDVKSLSKGISGTSSPSKDTATPRPATTSNYETKEERNARQRLIVRQSSLANAIEVLTTAKVYDATVIKNLAEDFTDWVFERGQTGLQNMEDDIPE